MPVVTSQLAGDIALDFPGKQRWDLWRVLDRLLQGTKVKKVYLWLLLVRRDEAERKLKKNKEGIAISAGNFSVEMVLCRKITISWNWKFLQELQAFRDPFCWEGKGDRWGSGQGDCPASLEHPRGLEGTVRWLTRWFSRFSRLQSPSPRGNFQIKLLNLKRETRAACTTRWQRRPSSISSLVDSSPHGPT